MKLTLEFTKPFTDAVGAQEIEFAFHGTTVEELLLQLVGRYPKLHAVFYLESGGVTEYMIIFVNGKPITALKGMNTTLANEDRIIFLFPISGG